jgi:ABC-2 type transport system permease protein
VNGRRVLAIFRRNYYVAIHSPPMLFDLLIWPLLDLMIWGLLTLFIEQNQAALPLPVGFLLGGVLLWDILFRANLGISISFLSDASWSRNLINLLVAPVRPVEYLSGALLFTMFKLALGWGVMILGAWALFNFNVFELGFALPTLILVLMVFGVALSMVVVGMVLRYGDGADILAWGLAGILSPLSCVYFPLSVLPAWLQPIALALPPAHVFEAMRAVLAGQPVPWGSILVAAVLDAVYLALAFAFVLAMFRAHQRKGFVSRYM